MTDTGGSAYPWVANEGPGSMDGGMTLLDYFAGQALAGLLGSCAGLDLIEEANKGMKHDITTASTKIAYAYARAMLDEKKQQVQALRNKFQSHLDEDEGTEK